MKPCLREFSPQTEEQHFQHYLRKQWLACLPDALRYGVVPEVFQGQVLGQAEPKRFARQGTLVVWVMCVKNQSVAHQLRFLAPELERRFWAMMFRDIQGQSALPEPVQRRLRHLPRFRLNIQVRPDYFQAERATSVLPPPRLLFQPQHFTETQAHDYLQAFLAKRFDGEDD